MISKKCGKVRRGKSRFRVFSTITQSLMGKGLDGAYGEKVRHSRYAHERYIFSLFTIIITIATIVVAVLVASLRQLINMKLNNNFVENGKEGEEGEGRGEG